MTSWQIPTIVASQIQRLATTLDRRLQPVFQLVFIGLLVTRERRRTATSWFRAVCLARDFQRGYRAIHAVGRKVETLSTEMLLTVARSPAVATDQRWCFTLDDTPTARYGPHVEGAGIHHNPTPGPAAHDFLYGHVWVTLGCLVQHPEHGAISLPVRAALYVREQEVPRLQKDYRWAFRTKMQQAADLCDWLGTWLKHKGKPLWLVADGAYAKREVLDAAKRNGITVVSRLRKDAALRSLPEPRRAGQRGRPRHYGSKAIRLAKRAAEERLDNRRVRAVWRIRDEDVQDILGDVGCGGWCDSRGAGEGRGWLARVFLYGPERNRGGHSRNGGGSELVGANLQRR